jgi:hypothetical protein
MTVLMTVLLLHSAGCNKKPTTSAVVNGISFEATPAASPLTNLIGEASGIADSRMNAGYCWVQEDSGNPPQLFLLSHDGNTIKKIYIKGASNRDWEDIALGAGPDPARKYIYIGEIGDNNAVHASSSFYRMEEPAAATDTVRSFDRISFAYADGPRDAEAFLVDDNTKDIFIITKRDLKARLYRIAYPYSTSTVNTAVFVDSLPYNGVVSAAVSADRSGIIVKTYQALFYYPLGVNETMAAALQKNYTALAYLVEPQGEAVCFAAGNSGFYTLSEKGSGNKQSLYFYKRK